MADEDKQDEELELDLDEQQANEPEPPADEGEEPEAEQPEQAPETTPIAAQESEVEQPQRPSRRDSRIASLTERVRDAEAERETFRRKLAEIEQRYQQPRPQGETPEQRAQRRALMTPQEVMQEDLRETRDGFTLQLNQMQAQNAEVADRTAFQAKCATDPLYAKYAPKVEGKLAEIRVTGANAPRETVLKYLIGEAALERRSSKEGRHEVAQARERVRRAGVKPPNSGSDTAAARRREESLERRLENQQI